MDRNFAILGLHENASKEQVKEAYERRLKKYKTADYADDPEYAVRKIRELKDAYERAYRMAGSGGIYRGDDDQRYARRESPKTDTQTREWDEDGRQKTGLKKLSDLADVSELKAKAENLKKTLKDSAGGLTDSFDDRKENTESTENIFTKKHRDSNKYRPPVKRKKSSTGSIGKKGAKGIAIATIIISLFPVILGMMEEFNNDWDYSYEPIYTYEQMTEEDRQIYDVAQEANYFVDENMHFAGGWEPKGSDKEELKETADTFALLYLGRGSMEEAVTYLYENYNDYFFATKEDTIEVQVDAVLDFYGFYSYSYMEGMEDPYRDNEPIETMTEYLNWLNSLYFDLLAENAV